MTDKLIYHCSPRIDTYVDVGVYTCSQHADRESNKWVMDEARYRRFKLENIYRFREATDADKSEYLLTDTIVPTDYCMMEAYDEWEKKRTSFMVVGNAEEMNKKLETINRAVNEKYEKLYEWLKQKEKEG